MHSQESVRVVEFPFTSMGMSIVSAHQETGQEEGVDAPCIKQNQIIERKHSVNRLQSEDERTRPLILI